jgi:hypothetical protein
VSGGYPAVKSSSWMGKTGHQPPLRLLLKAAAQPGPFSRRVFNRQY